MSNIDGIRMLLAESDFDQIGHIRNDDVRALLRALDRARGIAVALEQENAELLARLEASRAPF
jgi:hypothetical protein